MTPPTNFSGMPQQQPQAMQPYAANQQQQQAIIRAGKASGAGANNPAFADEIQRLENQTLPAGGNPVGAGLVTLGATALVTAGVSEGTYRWSDKGLESKLANSLKEAPATLIPISADDQKTFLAEAQQAKIDALSNQKNQKWEQAELKKLLGNNNKLSLNEAISNQQAMVDQLKGDHNAKVQQVAEHNIGLVQQQEAAFNATRNDAAKRLLGNPNASVADLPAAIGSLQTEIDKAPSSAKSQQVGLDIIVNARAQVGEASKNIAATEAKITAAENGLPIIKDNIMKDVVKNAENVAHNRGTYTIPALHNREVAKTKKAFAAAYPTADLNTQPGKQTYIDYLRTEYNKTAPKTPMVQVKLDDEIATDTRFLDAQKDIAQLKTDLANHQQTRANRESTLKGHEDGNRLFNEHQEKIKKLNQLKRLETSKHQVRADGMMVGELKSPELLAAEQKLQQLKNLEASKPTHTYNLNDTKIQGEIQADANKLAQAELDARKANLPEPALKPAMALKEAEGFGKPWKNVDDIKAKGFTQLAEHTTNSKWAGAKAGAVTALIGGALTLQQFLEAGKAQEASTARETRINQLRQQQQGA